MSKREKKPKPKPAMNVTPLVDIVLVLLIIFMVVLPNSENNAPVDLPNIFNVDADVAGQPDPVVISITEDLHYFYEKEELTVDTLGERLTELHQQQPLRRVVLRADGELKYGDVRPLFGRCQQIGFPGVALQVGERAGGPSAEDRENGSGA